MHMPILETTRLRIRPFALDDLEVIHRILDVDLATAEFGSEGAQSRAKRERWLHWTVLNYEALARLYQPPYGDRAIVLEASGHLIGAVGFVPSFGPFGQLSAFSPSSEVPRPSLNSTEFGLFYALEPDCQRQGYATEAARAMIGYAFAHLKVGRVIATTTYDNAASIRVMEKLGMRIERNPLPNPPWFQVVGVSEQSG